MKKVLLFFALTIIFSYSAFTSRAENETPFPLNDESFDLEKYIAEFGDHNHTQYLLGVWYYFGSDGIEQNYEKAVHWFTLSAEQGNNIAQEVLEIIRGQQGQDDVPFLNKNQSIIVIIVVGIIGLLIIILIITIMRFKKGRKIKKSNQ